MQIARKLQNVIKLHRIYYYRTHIIFIRLDYLEYILIEFIKNKGEFMYNVETMNSKENFKR